MPGMSLARIPPHRHRIDASSRRCIERLSGRPARGPDANFMKALEHLIGAVFTYAVT